ncbi:Leucine rich repeat containing protein, partial [Euroglyphus maynei]
INNKCPLALCGDDFFISLVRQCPRIKIVYPSNKSFRGLIDVSLFESCQALELIRIPFYQLHGTETLRQNLRSLIWVRGNYESISESTYSLWQSYRQHGSMDSKSYNFKPLRIDELFWDKFGSWPSLTHLCISHSNIIVMNASTMPNSIVTLDLRCNLI